MGTVCSSDRAQQCVCGWVGGESDSAFVGVVGVGLYVGVAVFCYPALLCMHGCSWIVVTPQFRSAG